MSSEELTQTLIRLNLWQQEAAQLLSVTPRTMRRWMEGEELPGPAEQALRAWVRLHERLLPWRPDSVSVSVDDQEQIALNRRHTIGLDEMLSRVEARGGSQTPWQVDRARCCAMLGPIQVGYVKLQSGGFSLTTYRRSDTEPDVQRDQALIEDAAFCIAQAMRREPEFGPVMLVWHDAPWRRRIVTPTHRRFETTADALAYVREAMGSPGFHDPFIMAVSHGDSARLGNEVLWTKEDLQRECGRRSTAPAEIAVVGNYVKQHAGIFVRHGPRVLTQNEADDRRRRIDACGDKLLDLAGKVEMGRAGYRQFEQILGELHALGFFPTNEMVAAVARSLTGR